MAQALATEEQVRAYGGPQFQVTQQVMNRFADAIQQSKVDVVPRIMVTGSNGGEGSSTSGSVMEGLLTMLLSERYSQLAGENSQVERSPEADALRKQIYQSMKNKPASGEADKANQ